jgi:hypothetical protein
MIDTGIIKELKPIIYGEERTVRIEGEEETKED